MRARTANMGSSNVRQLLLLLSWTVFFCCVVYVRRLKTIPDTPEDSLASLYAARSKRSSDMAEQAEGHCTNSARLRDITKLLENTARAKRHVPDVPFVHCSVLRKCSEGDGNDTVICHSAHCSQFRLHFRNADHVFSWLNGGELSDHVRSHLSGKAFTLGVDMEIHCQHPHSHKLQLAVDILPSARQCSHKKESQLAGDVDERSLRSVHILYFRFLSHWELPVLFPGLTAFVEESSERRGLRLMKFPNHQATRWDDDEVLSMLLQGRGNKPKATVSLLDTVHESRRCLRLEDLSCGPSPQMQRLVSQVAARRDVVCADVPLAHRQAAMEMLCRSENATDSDTRRALNSLLMHVHGGDTGMADRRPRLAVSLLHTKDFPNTDILDASLKNLLVSLLNDPDNLVLIMSGVGSPDFLSFDEDALLHIQASNPALLLATRGNLSTASDSLARRLSQSLFSMAHVHVFVQTLLGNQHQAEASPGGVKALLGNQSETVEASRQVMAEDSCRSLNVSPPFSCLYEEQFVDYENDTLMIGFAEFAVSVINSQLPNWHPASLITTSSSRCSRWSGLSFSKVRVGQHAGKKRIWMDLLLENTLSRDTALRRATLDLWDLDKVQRAEVRFYEQGPGSWTPTERPWKTLCVTGDNMDGAVTWGPLLLKRWSEEKHFGHKALFTDVHDACLYLLLRDFGDSLSLEVANVCVDRHYHVTLHLSLLNMISLSALPLSVSVGPAGREFVAGIVKVSYTVPTFAYKLYPDFEVSYEV